MRFFSMMAASVVLFGLNAEAQTTTTIRDLPNGRGRVSPGDPYVKSFDRISAEGVWRAVEIAYRQAGIRPTEVHAGGYNISYVASPAGKKIGNLKIEHVFDCGGDKKAPLAATTELAVSVSTRVRPIGDGAESATSVRATAAVPADGSPTPVCTSKGALERRLEPQIKVKVMIVSTPVRR